jgi:signal transduction histidine kinase
MSVDPETERLVHPSPQRCRSNGEDPTPRLAAVVEPPEADADYRERLLAQERDRIARDLNEVVIQRLFSAGLALTAARQSIGEPQLAARVAGAVDDLDAVIGAIRRTIFAPDPPVPTARGVRSQMLDLAVSASDTLGFDPAVRFDGPVDRAVPDDLVAHVLAVAREALANVAQHARATRVEVHLSAGDDIAVVVTDNGVGWGTSTRHGGLNRCRSRAERLGGTLNLTLPPGGGTRLEWRIPIPR